MSVLSAFLAVDIQNGFITERGELPVAGGAEVIPIINSMLPRFPVRVASQDWHPPDHGSFASNNPGRKPFDLGELDGVPQVFWPDHCVQGTRGAELHPDFDQVLIQAIVRKGMDRRADSYSVFTDNARRNPTGLQGYLEGLGVGEVTIAGLALDYCVRFSALDVRRLMPSITVRVVVDACRPVDPRTGEEAKEEMRASGVLLIDSSEVLA